MCDFTFDPLAVQPTLANLWHWQTLRLELIGACVLFLVGWLITALIFSDTMRSRGRLLRYAALATFALTIATTGIAYITWSRLEFSWHYAYHIALVASHCSPIAVDAADQRLQFVAGGLLLGICLMSGLGVFLSWWSPWPPQRQPVAAAL